MDARPDTAFSSFLVDESSLFAEELRACRLGQAVEKSFLGSSYVCRGRSWLSDEGSNL